MATGLVALLALLPACSDATGDRASGSAATAVTTSTSAPAQPSTTTAPSSTLPARSTTTAPASTPEGHARALYQAWTAGDRAAAEKVADAEAVNTLFARQWSTGDGWTFLECSGAAGSVICAWERPTGQQLLMRVRNATGGLPVAVAEVRFEP